MKKKANSMQLNYVFSETTNVENDKQYGYTKMPLVICTVMQ